MKRAAHRAIDRAVRALTPADGATPYRPAGKVCDPESFLASPGPPPEFTVEKARRGRLGGHPVLRRRFAFQSPVKSGLPANDVVRGHWIAPLQQPVRASLVVLHRWRTPIVRPMWRSLGVAIAAGAEVFLPAHPYHGWRRPRLTYSGLPLLSADLDRSLRAMRQAVLDVRRLLLWVACRGQGPIVLVGIDLGGLVAGVAATVHDGLSGLVLVAPHDNVGEILWQGQTDRGRIRWALERAGVAREELIETFSVLDPGWRAPLVPREKVLIVAGRYDDVVEPSAVRRLAERWGDVRTSWHDFAHGSAALATPAIMRESLALVGLAG